MILRVLLVVAMMARISFGFTIAPPRRVFSLHSMSIEQQEAATEKEVLKDSQGKEIVEGSTVQVSAAGLQAFHVNKKAHGSFNDEGQFVPTVDAKKRKDKALILPIGMRGVVTRIYDIDEISSNLPVRVVFEPNDDEKWSPPLKFIMHFDTNEIECV